MIELSLNGKSWRTRSGPAGTSNATTGRSTPGHDVMPSVEDVMPSVDDHDVMPSVDDVMTSVDGIASSCGRSDDVMASVDGVASSCGRSELNTTMGASWC